MTNLPIKIGDYVLDKCRDNRYDMCIVHRIHIDGRITVKRLIDGVIKQSWNYIGMGA